MLSIEKNLIRDSMELNQNVVDIFAQLKNRRAKFLLGGSRASIHCFKIGSQHIIFDSFCLRHLDSLSIFGTKIYHSRQFILFNVHGSNTLNYKNSLTKNYLPELIISLNSRRENNSF